MLCVAYDAMTRRSELIAIDVQDLKFLHDGTGRLLIRRSKTDQAGAGHIAYVSRQTTRFVKTWLRAAEMKEGPYSGVLSAAGQWLTTKRARAGSGVDWVPRRLPGRSRPWPGT